MKLPNSFSWPPSPDSLGPVASGEGSPHDPERLVRAQHRQLARILRNLAEAAEHPVLPAENEEAETRWRRNLRLSLGELNAFIENHRDIEESFLFPQLLEVAEELGPTLDDLSDDHVRIFDENRRLNLLMDRLDLVRRLGASEQAELLPPLRSFVEGLWRHTLVEEAMLDQIRGRIE